MSKICAANHDFFMKWDHDMAYVLGFFAADGCMIRNSRGGHFIEFHITDRDLLRTIRTAMQSSHKIAIRTKDPKHKVGYRMQIGSIKMYHQLQSLGFTPRKSLTLRMPEVPSDYFPDFVRGYFDGDGCIYFKHLKFSDRKNLRWIVLSLFTSGSREFLSRLHDELKKRGITGGSLKRKTRGFELMFSSRDSLALYRLMYNTASDTGLYLPRKYKLFQRAMAKLYPNAAVV